MLRTVSTILLLAAVNGAALSSAPPASEAPGKEAPQAPAAAPPAGEREGEGLSRAFLERRLEESRAETARLEDAIQRLKSGAPIAEIRRALGAGRQRGPEGQGRGDRFDGPDRSDRPDGPGGPDGRRHERFGRGGPMPPEVRERVLAFLKEHAPEAAERLAAFREERPMLADRMLDEIAGQLQELRGLRDREPEMFGVRLRAIRLDWDLRRLAFDHARARHAAANGGPPADEAAFRERAKDLFSRRFDVSLEERALQVKDMEQRLTRLKAEVAEGAGKREEVVARQIDRMLDHLSRPAPGMREGGPDGREAEDDSPEGHRPPPPPR
jgi:DNA-binding transcriptional MerR regulator